MCDNAKFSLIEQHSFTYVATVHIYICKNLPIESSYIASMHIGMCMYKTLYDIAMQL